VFCGDNGKTVNSGATEKGGCKAALLYLSTANRLMPDAEKQSRLSAERRKPIGVRRLANMWYNGFNLFKEI
jgi:hypothetical protein